MRDKKNIIVIVLILIITIIAIIISIRNKQDKNSTEGNLEISVNSETGEYYITTNNNEIITAEDKSMLQIYIDDPNYKINPTKESNEEHKSYDESTINDTIVYDNISKKWIDTRTGSIVEY